MRSPVLDTNAPTRLGDHVRVVPTQGGYQKDKVGQIIGETKTEWRVIFIDSQRPVRFRKSNGRPVEKYDQEFPCYCMQKP